MILPPEAIKEFKQVYRGEFGEDLSAEEAYEKLHRLINFLRAALVPPSYYARITKTDGTCSKGLDQKGKCDKLKNNN
ncbi:MAG: hypothetical protein JRJ03_00350 [Deltaproteobacteria bacterium]|nr:hypothetical protein [Deltaproteobacteria bacterium]